MNLFETHYNSIKELIDLKEYNLLLKRLIDLALDTEDTVYYRKMLNLLTWYNDNGKSEEADLKLEKLLSELFQVLIEKTTKKPETVLSVKNLVKRYSNSSFHLGPISLDVKEGEVVGLVGENGNGKTTLLRCLSRELVQTSGSVAYNFEYDNDYDLRTKLIYIPQRTDTWQGSLLDNLQFTASCYGIEGEENELLVDLIIHRMGLWRFRDYGWKNLSSGYKMRFELARMLLRKPKLLLIDEPLANLDILAQQIVLDDFKDIAKSPFRPLAIILSSQQLYAVESASDQVVFLKEGKPRMLHEKLRTENVSEEEESFYIVEFECKLSQVELTALLKNLYLIKLQLNGGTYVAQFSANVTQLEFFDMFVSSGTKLDYYRDISNSTRKFFLS